MKMIVLSATMCLVLGCQHGGAPVASANTANESEEIHPWLKPTMILSNEWQLRNEGYDPADLESVKKAASDPKWPSVRRNAIRVLCARMSMRAGSIYRQALDDPYQSVRCDAATALAICDNKEGLVRMRKDLAHAIPAQSDTDIDKAADLNERQKEEAKRLRWLQLNDALAAAKVLAEFGNRSGYDLALKVINGDEHPLHRSRAVEILSYISKADPRVLRAEHRDPDAIILTLIETQQRDVVFRAILNYADVHRRPEVGLRILKTLAKSPYLLPEQREDVERSLRYYQQGFAKPWQTTPPRK